MPRYRLLEQLAGRFGALITVSEQVDGTFLDAGNRLRIVSNFGAGVDHIDVAECTRRGVVVANTPDVVTDATADMTWALLLAASRRVVEGDRLLRRRTPWQWTPEMLLGQSPTGRTLGIVGMGHIGQAVARRARGFSMRILYNQRSRHPANLEKKLGATYVQFDELLVESDFISVHVPLTSDTRHMFGRREFGLMKPNAIFVNTSRGPIVDERSLSISLRHGRPAAAGLDVFEHEPDVNPSLPRLDNVVMTPHLGSATYDARAAIAMAAARNLVSMADCGEPVSAVNIVA